MWYICDGMKTYIVFPNNVILLFLSEWRQSKEEMNSNVLHWFLSNTYMHIRVVIKHVFFIEICFMVNNQHTEKHILITKYIENRYKTLCLIKKLRLFACLAYYSSMTKNYQLHTVFMKY